MTDTTMARHLALTTVLVSDYDEAIDYYVNTLGFTLIEDTPTSPSTSAPRLKRWVVVSPSIDGRGALLLAQAADDKQIAQVGNQTGGRVFLFLYTDDFWRDYALYQSRGVVFVRGEPREEAYGTVAVFKDLAGNLWDLVEPNNPRLPAK